jgi:hypothetical protein
MRRVIIESPYAGDVDTHVTYARRALRDSLSRGEAPLASHLLYTQPGILDDSIPAERKLGIEVGLVWMREAEAVIFYVDYGVSKGMGEALVVAIGLKLKTERRTIGPNP